MVVTSLEVTLLQVTYFEMNSMNSELSEAGRSEESEGLGTDETLYR